MTSCILALGRRVPYTLMSAFGSLPLPSAAFNKRDCFTPGTPDIAESFARSPRVTDIIPRCPEKKAPSMSVPTVPKPTMARKIMTFVNQGSLKGFSCSSMKRGFERATCREDLPSAIHASTAFHPSLHTRKCIKSTASSRIENLSQGRGGGKTSLCDASLRSPAMSSSENVPYAESARTGVTRGPRQNTESCLFARDWTHPPEQTFQPCCQLSQEHRMASNVPETNVPTIWLPPPPPTNIDSSAAFGARSTLEGKSGDAEAQWFPSPRVFSLTPVLHVNKHHPGDGDKELFLIRDELDGEPLSMRLCWTISRGEQVPASLPCQRPESDRQTDRQTENLLQPQLSVPKCLPRKGTQHDGECGGCLCRVWGCLSGCVARVEMAGERM